MLCTALQRKCSGFDSRQTMPQRLASPFTPYDDIDENAVVLTYFVLVEAERLAVRIRMVSIHISLLNNKKVPYIRVTSTCHVRNSL
jgi:hypothetical protein